MSFAIENSGSPFANAPIIYRSARSDWGVVAILLVVVAGLFVFACWPWLNMGELTAKEIAGSQNIVSNVPGVWLPFGLGALLLTSVFVQSGSLLRARVIFNENGLLWRPFPFVGWRSARWDEITDCVLPRPKTSESAAIVIGEERIALEITNPAWPTLRDFVAAQVAAPDGMDVWHLPAPENAEARRAQRAKLDDGAPIRTPSKVWPILVLGCVYIALISSIFRYVANKDLNLRPSDQIFLWIIIAFIAAFLIVSPLLSHWRRYIVADADGLLFSRILRQRRIGYEQIEDLFLLSTERDSAVHQAYIVVAGENIVLEYLGHKRDAILNRIEARAFNSRSPQFELRDALPVGAELPLPATLTARAARVALLRQSALFALVAVGLFAGLTAVIVGIGWRYFGTTRGIFLLGALGYGLMLVGWARHFVREWRLLRARGDARLLVDEAGLTMRQSEARVRIEWAQIRAFTRDSRSAVGDVSFRVEANDGAAIEWENWWPRAFLVAALVAEKCDVALQPSPRTERQLRGLTRDAEGFTVSKNTPAERAPIWITLGTWATFSIIPSFEMSARDWIWLQLLGWPSLLLYGALFYGGALARVRIRCEARGLSYRGLWRERFIAWADVAEFGAGIYCDFVRARDRRTIRIWRSPDGSSTWAQLQLRQEIRRRAPHARGDWKIN